MKKVVIYTTNYCPFCFRVKDLFTAKGVAFEEIDVTNDPGRRAEVSAQTKSKTVPMVFIDGTFVGGCTDVEALDAKGELDGLLRD